MPDRDRRGLVETRELEALDEAAFARLERAFEAHTGRAASGTEAGEVFGVSDERGLNVLVQKHAGGATLTVNDARANRAVVSALLFGLFALLLVGPATFISVTAPHAATIALSCLLAVLLPLGYLARRRAQNRKIGRVADKLSAALVRVDVREEGVDAEAELEVASAQRSERAQEL